MNYSQASIQGLITKRLEEASEKWSSRPTMESIRAELLTLQKTVNNLRKSLDKGDKIIDGELLQALGSLKVPEALDTINQQLVYVKTKYGMK